MQQIIITNNRGCIIDCCGGRRPPLLYKHVTLYYYNSKFQMTINYFFCVFENEYGASLSAVPRCLLGSDAMS